MRLRSNKYKYERNKMRERRRFRLRLRVDRTAQAFDPAARAHGTGTAAQSRELSSPALADRCDWALAGRHATSRTLIEGSSEPSEAKRDASGHVESRRVVSHGLSIRLRLQPVPHSRQRTPQQRAIAAGPCTRASAEPTRRRRHRPQSSTLASHFAHWG